MKNIFQKSGAQLRARTRALCALILALLVSATVSAQDWGNEATTGSGVNINAAFASVTMNVTTVGATKRVQMTASSSGNQVWLALVVDGTLSVSSIDDIPVGTYTITNTGAASTALASQGLSGSNIIGTGGRNSAQYLHATAGTVYVFDDNTDDHHHLIHLRATEFHQPAVNDPSGKVKAQFFPSGSISNWKYAQTVTTCGTGTVSGTGSYIGRDRTFTATPDGTTFSYWVDGDGNLVSTDNPVTFTAWGPAELKAVFSDGVASCPAAGATPSTFTVTWKSEDGLTTLETDADLASGTATSFDAATPTKVATAQYTYTFDGWATEANGAKVYNINGTPAATADATYYAHFSQTTNTYTVAATVSPAGAGTISGTGTFAYGTDVTLTATPTNRRYRFVRWTESAVQKATTASYTIDDIDAAHTLVAVFEEIPVTLADNEESSYYSTTLSTFTGSMNFQLMRTFYAGMWNTVCFPFALSASQIAASDMSGATFYTLTSVTGDAAEGLDFNVSEVTSLSARTPYLVQVSGSNIVNPVFEGVTLDANAFTNNTSGTNVGDTKFFGTVHPTDLEIGENSGFLFLGQNNALYWPNVANKIRAFRAYFYSGDGVVQSVHPRVRIVLQNETTTDLSDKSEQSAPSVKKYMENGSLVIEKNGKKYNAVGQEIK